MSKRRRFDSDDDEDDIYTTTKTELTTFASSKGINWPDDEDENDSLIDFSDPSTTKPLSPSQEAPSSSSSMDQRFRSVTNGIQTFSTRTLLETSNSPEQESPGKVVLSSSSMNSNATGMVGNTMPTLSTSSFSSPLAFVQPCDKDISQEYFSVLSTSVVLRSYWATLRYLFSRVDKKSVERIKPDDEARRADINAALVLAQYVPSSYCTTQAAASLPAMENSDAHPLPGWRWDGVIRGRTKKS